MKAPKGIESIAIDNLPFGTEGAYPPLGFKPFCDSAGNGDYFGLYWPYGREDREPIVCDMRHDGWSLVPAFSNLPIFLQWLDANDGMPGDIQVDDPNLVSSRYDRAKSLLAEQPHAAIAMLQSICDDFPESSDYWFTFASQLRRTGDQPGSVKAAIHAIASNWIFGMPSPGALRILQGAQKMNEFENDPLVRRSFSLGLSFGGAKENTNYALLKECIAEYLDSNQAIIALLLNQNYGYLMAMETVSFQERNSFNLKTWLEHHCSLCAKYLGDQRTTIA